MYISTPSQTLQLGNQSQEITENGTHYLLSMHRESAKFFLKNTNAQPNEEEYQEIIAYVVEIAGIHLTLSEVIQILALYPHARIKVAEYHGLTDTHVRDEISFLIAHFFLGCSWPVYHDQIDMDEFIHLLKLQARLMGYGVE